jgi:hypothetical protein
MLGLRSIRVGPDRSVVARMSRPSSAMRRHGRGERAEGYERDFVSRPPVRAGSDKVSREVMLVRDDGPQSSITS